MYTMIVVVPLSRLRAARIWTFRQVGLGGRPNSQRQYGSRIRFREQQLIR